MDEPTVTVHVHYYSILADYASARQADVTLKQGASVAQLLNTLLDSNPAAFKSIMMNGAKRSAFVRVFRNGELVSEENEQTSVADGDEYKLFPAISGG